MKLDRKTALPCHSYWKRSSPRPKKNHQHCTQSNYPHPSRKNLAPRSYVTGLRVLRVLLGCRGSTEPLNGGISRHFAQNFTPNRFQTGRLSRFGVKCRLFGGERGWRAHQRPPTPANPSQGQPTSDTKSIHSKTGRAIKARSNLAVGVLPLAYVCPGNGELLAVVWP
ncbi:hypothetical protein FRC0405_02242 [Corynebacterium diphtheriae]|nr:hypothetical protein FRC0405_02242 [Corynebacterium diphtheriae]